VQVLEDCKTWEEVLLSLPDISLNEGASHLLFDRDR
jgi:hypothetical protein